MTELEKAAEESILAATDNVTSLAKARSSVAEQMLGVATTIKGIHQEIDRLEAEIVGRLNAIRKTLGGKA